MSARRDDRILPESRAASAVLAPVLATAFVILYIFPGDTDRFFAWTIQPKLTPILIGAGYGAGAYFATRMFTSRQWHRIGNAFITITAFTWPMMLATVLHWDRFNHDHVSFWLWAALYLTLPFVLPVLWYRNRSTDPGTPEPDDVIVPWQVRRAMGVAGVGQLLIGLVMFAFPDPVIDIWPWALTPLTCRVLAGWFALPGVGAIVIAAERRWSASRIPLEGALIYSALILIGVVRAWDDIDASNALAWVYVGSIIASLVGIAALHVTMESRQRGKRRAEPEELPASALRSGDG